MSEFTSVAKTTDLAHGEGKVVEANGTAIALFNIDGTFHAIDNTCLHRGGPLGDGMCDGATVTCPWHGWQYDVTSGECLNMPGEQVDRYEVLIEGDDVRVKA
ncbi:MAG: Rieske (2Fe-2S) protein [Acidobacteriota bacterium]